LLDTGFGRKKNAKVGGGYARLEESNGLILELTVLEL
jgi:hypothetical protein